MKFNSIRIVLVETSHPGNIGSTARAMKTMGLQRLYLVSPLAYPDRKANELAAGADDVLEQCIVTTSLTDALRGCHLVLATSARPRDIALSGLTPASAASLIGEAPDTTEIAIVFGREHAGLTNDELLQCQYHIHIPSNPAFASLNLSQAVQIVAYELRMRLLSPVAQVEMAPNQRATIDEVERFYAHLQEVMVAVDFLKPSNPKKLMHRLRRMFNRIQLETIEVNILRGLLTQVNIYLSQSGKIPNDDSHLP